MPTIKIVPFPGVPGPQGPRGLQGIQGETGLTGPMGPRGEVGPVGPQGEPGLNGLEGEQGPAGVNGADGQDALWNFVGEYDNGADYEVGDVVTYNGGTYYRILGPNTGYAPGTEYWTTIAEPGSDGADGSDGEDAETPEEVSYSVTGGSLGTPPAFIGDPLFSGSYVKTGPLVHFQIQVDMDNITNFGTGQYVVVLPFLSKHAYQVRQGCLHDVSTGRQYSIGGHVLPNSANLALTFTNTNGQDEVFDHNSPITLTSEDNFHISGTYITY